MSPKAPPLHHILQTCAALALLTAPAHAQLDCAAAAQADLEQLIGQGSAAVSCSAAAPGEICAASGHPGACSLHPDCTGISITSTDGCAEPPGGAYGAYGEDEDAAGCCVLLYTNACTSEDEAQAGGGCDAQAAESAAMCRQSCGAQHDGGAADSTAAGSPPSLAASDGVAGVGFVSKGRGGGGRSGGFRGRSRSSPSYYGGDDSGAAGHRGAAAAAAVCAGLITALAAAV